MTNLYLLCGIPGSGKSTWARKFLENKTDTIWISRDLVRFALVDKDQPYFSNENKVFSDFVLMIRDAMTKYENVIIDATHLNEKSRNKVLDKLFINEDISIHAVNFLLDTDSCMLNNNKRIGRERVPDSAMYRMANSFRPAAAGEKYHYNEIIEVR